MSPTSPRSQRPVAPTAILPLPASVQSLITASSRFPTLASVVHALAQWSSARGAKKVALDVDLASSLVVCHARPWPCQRSLRELLPEDAILSDLARIGSLVVQLSDARGRRHLGFLAADEQGLPRVSVDESQGPLDATSTSIRISLRDIFAELPVRQRLLADPPTSRAELSSCRKALSLFALAHPELNFSLDGRQASLESCAAHDVSATGKRTLIDVRSTHSFASRFADLHDARLAAHDIDARQDEGGAQLRVRGFIALELQAVREAQFVFVNGRHVGARDAGHDLVAALRGADGDGLDSPTAGQSRWTRDSQDLHVTLGAILRRALADGLDFGRAAHPCFVLVVDSQGPVEARQIHDALRRTLEETLVSLGMMEERPAQSVVKESFPARTEQRLISTVFRPMPAGNKQLGLPPAKRSKTSLGRAVSKAASEQRAVQSGVTGSVERTGTATTHGKEDVSRLVGAAYDAASYPHLRAEGVRPMTSALEMGQLRSERLRGRHVRPATMTTGGTQALPSAPPPEWLQNVVETWTSPALPVAGEPPIPILGSGVGVGVGGEGAIPSLVRHRCEGEEQQDGNAAPKPTSSQRRQSRFFSCTEPEEGDRMPSTGTLYASLRPEMLRDARVLQQIDGKFIAAVLPCASTASNRGSGSEGRGKEASLLVLVDQHAADERVRFEDILHEYVTGCAAGKEDAMTRLANPLDLESALLSQQQSAGGRAALQALCSEEGVKTARFWGFDIVVVVEDEDEGRGSATLARVPQVLVERLDRDRNALVDVAREMGAWLRDEGEEACRATSKLGERWKAALDVELGLEPRTDADADADGVDSASPSRTPLWLLAQPFIPRRVLQMLSSKACRGAIMFNDDVEPSRARELLRSLAKTWFPWQCAHGRPAVVPLARLG